MVPLLFCRECFDKRLFNMEAWDFIARLSTERRRYEEAFLRAADVKHQFGAMEAVMSNLRLMQDRSWEMAKKAAEARGKEKKKAEFKGFCNIELTLEEKAEMKEWIRSQEDVAVELDELAASGYKLTVQRSEAMGSYQATAFCTDNELANAGYILSAFAPHWWDALACLAYKHAVKCEGIWPLKDEGNGDLWG